MSNTSEIVRTFTSETLFNEGGSAELTSQEKTQNAAIEQNIGQNPETEMLPGDPPIALDEKEGSQKNYYPGPNYLMQSLMKIRDQAKK